MVGLLEILNLSNIYKYHSLLRQNTWYHLHIKCFKNVKYKNYVWKIVNL